MKSNRTLALLAAAVLVALAASPALAGEKADHPKGQSKIVIAVEGMTCAGCSSSVEYAVKKLDGVTDVTVDHEKGSAAVTYDKEKVTVDQIVAAISKTGYKAKKPEKKG